MDKIAADKARGSARHYSKVIRAAAGLNGTPYPIVDVDGFQAPRLVGESYHWTTPAGTLVRHHSAFARRGWPTVYHSSTLRIEVGRGWLIQNGLA